MSSECSLGECKRLPLDPGAVLNLQTPIPPQVPLTLRPRHSLEHPSDLQHSSSVSSWFYRGRRKVDGCSHEVSGTLQPAAPQSLCVFLAPCPLPSSAPRPRLVKSGTPVIPVLAQIWTERQVPKGHGAHPPARLFTVDLSFPHLHPHPHPHPLVTGSIPQLPLLFPITDH